MTRFYYDTEFHERGPEFPIDLISIGAISEYGQSYYAVNAEFDFEAAQENSWLDENVLRFIPTDMGRLDLSHPKVKPRSEIKADLERLFEPKIVLDKTELWAYYADYDHVLLSQIFGRMIDLPDYIPMYTRDIKQEVDRLGIDPKSLPVISPHLEHHALNDAIHDMTTHYFVKAYEREQKRISGV